MKEILAIIRINKINDTKKALADAGYIPMTCRKVYGRGKKKVDFQMIEEFIEGQPNISPKVMESLSETHRLIAKRFIIMVVEDASVAEVVKILIETNQTGNMGDGKIFISPVDDAIRIRTDERGEAAV